MVVDREQVDAAYGRLIARLRVIRRGWRWLAFAEGLLKCVGLLSFVVAGVVLVLGVSFGLWEFPVWRWVCVGIVLLAVGGSVYGVIRFFVLPLLGRLSDAAVAARLESRLEDFGVENRVLSAVQLWETLDENRLGYASEFVEDLVLAASRDIERIEERRVFAPEFRRVWRHAGIAVGGVVVLLVSSLLLPNTLTGFVAAFDRLPETLQVDQEGVADSIRITEVRPGNVEITRGSDVRVTAEVSGGGDAGVDLYYRVGDSLEDATWESVRMQAVSSGGVLSYSIENVTRPFAYYVSVGGVQSEQYQVRISDEPFVTRFQYRLEYPAYTGLQPQVVPENVGDLEVLFGTRVVFTGASNKRLARAVLAFETSGERVLSVTGQEVGGTAVIAGGFIAETTERYQIVITDVEGSTNRDPINWQVTVLEDAVPEIAVVAPGRDTVLDEAMVVDVKVEATDDYGLQALALVYRVENEGSESVRVPLKAWTESPRSVSVAYRWDVDRVGIFPGETLAYYVEALDIDDVSGPNVGRSGTYTLRFPSLSELYESLAVEQESEQSGLDELIDDQTDATGLVAEILDKIRKNQALSLSDESLMEEVLENQKQIEEAAKELVEDMKGTAAEMEQNQLFDTETIEKYEELQALMEEALSEEHKALLRKLAEALAQQDLSDREQSMSEANLSQEQFLEQLERTKALYEQILLEQELEAAAKQAKALAEQQQALMETLEGVEAVSIMRGLAEQEGRVRDEFGALREKLETLGTEMTALAETNENAPPQIGRLGAEITRLNAFAGEQRVSERLAAAAESLRSGEKTPALESGRDAGQTLTELAQGLENALAFMEGANANETLTVLQEAVASGLYLSHLHEKTLVATGEMLLVGGPGTYVPNEILRLQGLAADQLSAAEGLTQLSTQLWELGNRQITVPPEAVWHLNAANDALSRAARALEDRQPRLAVPIQRAALADLNQAVFELLASLDEMNQQMDSSGFENMMEQLQQLAESQEQLNEMAENLSQQMREQGRTPGMEQMLQRLGEQQAFIREATERIAERAEQLAEMLGSLEDVAAEMAGVEQSLRAGELNEQVLDRQSRILTRMLESLKSLQKRDMGRQRRAEVAARPELPAADVPPLHPELLEIVQKLEIAPDSKEFEALPFQYREQLRLYFKALSRKTE